MVYIGNHSLVDLLREGVGAHGYDRRHRSNGGRDSPYQGQNGYRTG